MASGFWRRHFTTVALSVAAVLALVVYVLVDRGRISSHEAKRREGQLLPAFRRADLTLVRVERPGLAALRLERDAAPDAGELDFRMLSPLADADIDAVTVDHLLTAFEYAPVVRKLDAEPSEFGVSSARVELAMGTVHYAFELGGLASTPADARYLRLTQATGAASDVVGTYVVPASFVNDLLVSAHDYRSKQIVPYLSIALAALEVNGAGVEGLRLERTSTISFRIQKTGARASRKRLDGIWAAMAETRIEAFAETPADETELAAAVRDPAFVVIMEPEQGARAELRYGGPCPRHPELIVVQRTAPTPLLGCVPKEAKDGLSVRAETLADRGLFALFADEVAELSAERGRIELELAREGSGFRRRRPDPKLLDANEQTSFDAALSFLFAEQAGAVLGTKAAFERTAWLRVVGGRGAPGGGELTEQVELGTCAVPPNAALPCARRASGDTLLLPAAAYQRALPTPDWMRSVDLGLPSERAARIDLDCGAAQRLVRSDAGYAYAAPAPGALDEGRALELADFLRRFRASGFVAADVEHAADFARTHCRVALGQASPSSGEVALELGEDQAKSMLLGRVVGRPEVFLADPELRTMLSRVYLRRTFWNETEGIEQLTLQQGGQRTLVLRGDAGDSRLDAVSSFRATDVVHLGPARADEGFATPWLTVFARAGKVERGLRIAKEPTAAGALVRFDGVDATFSAAVDVLTPLLRSTSAAVDGGR